VTVGGRDLGELRRSKVPYLRRAIGCVFQDFRLLPDRTAAENVAYALQVTGHSQKEVRRRVPEILSLVGLDDKFDRLPRELSGGEQQRVSIARALVNHPRLLIADEPTGNLDPETSLGIMDLLLRINRTGTTVLVATHDQHTVDRMQMRVIALEAGRVVRDEESAGYHEDTGEVLA
jgi:cell division transport system ATP-binding protein